MDYLRNRPFLAVELSYLPAKGVNTGRKGWQDQPGAMQTLERVSFVDRIKDLSKFTVVIDIINSVVLQNRSSMSSDEVMAAYLGNYREQVTQALSVWARREAIRMRDAGELGNAIEEVAE